MKRLLRVFGFLLALFALLAGLSPVAAQSDRSVAWERFDVAIDVLPDATLRVVHTEQIRFNGTFRSAFREIPLNRVSSITEVQVGEPGQPYRPGYNEPRTYAVTRSDDRLRIDWYFPPTTNAVRTFELSYRVSGAIAVYPDGDQLRWEAVPADRPGPVRAADIVVRLPQPVSMDQLRAQGYVDGRPRAADPTISSQEIRFSEQDIPPDTRFEVRVQFPHGLVPATPPAWQAAYDRQAWYDSAVRPALNILMLLVALAILAAGTVAIVLTWFMRGRDPSSGAEVREVDAPPSSLPPGLAGTVVDEHADVHDVLATLIDLGNRGIIRITEERNPALLGSDLDYKLERLQPETLGLRPYERTVIGALFGPNDEVRLSQVKDRWSANIPLFQQQLYTEAVQAGLFVVDPDAVRRRWRSGAIAVIVGAIVLGILATALFGSFVNLIWAPFAAAVVVGLVALAAARRMPQRTKAGVVEAAQWRAYARHLKNEGRRASRTDPERFAKVLPYAIALGADRSWLENFAAVGRPVPRWQMGDGPVVIWGPGGWGFPGNGSGGSFGGPWNAPGSHQAGGSEGSTSGPGGLGGWSGGMAGGLGSASGSLSDLLNAASEALSSGGGGGWSGGGGDWGGGGGGDSGGSAGFD